MNLSSWEMCNKQQLIDFGGNRDYEAYTAGILEDFFHCGRRI